MQTYRLQIGPDGNVHIPNGEPGRMVTVLLDEAVPSYESTPLKPVSAMTREEKEQLKADFLERGRRVRERMKDQEPVDHGAEHDGEDGLPK